MAEPEKSPTEAQPERRISPWEMLFAEQQEFVSDLECLTEMLSLVDPVLRNRDEERQNRLKELGERIETEKGAQIRFKSLEQITEYIENIRKIRRADKMFREGIITSIVSQFDDFMVDVLKVAYEHNPGWLKNPDKKITYKELLEIQSLESLKAEIIEKEVDLLMRDSHESQVSFIDSKLKLGIESGFSRWKEFLEITERRNLYAHTGGRVSSQYLTNCKCVGIPTGDKVVEGRYLPANEKYILNAADCFHELSVRIVQAVVRRLFPQSFDNADRKLNNGNADLLTQGRWALSERLGEYALGIPEDLTSKGELRFYFLINLCIALKFGGKPFSERLHSVDWKPFHPKYHFAVAVLEERFDDAEKLMRTQAVHEEIGETNFKTWPLLRDFRKTIQFQNAYLAVYNKDLKEELIGDAKKEIAAQQESAPIILTDSPPSEGSEKEATASGS